MKQQKRVMPIEYKKVCQIVIRASAAEVEEIDNRAAKSGMSRSAYLRYKALGHK